jgi:nanoRNase/pAp phosphatase (c-di-AMP/oligoRNAs hydrolase)
MRVQDQEVRALLKNVVYTKWLGADVAIVNCAPKYASDLGSAMNMLHPEKIFIAYYDLPGKRCFSLRSKTIDVSKIAAEMGGGGHPAAAGFEKPLTRGEIL